MLLSIIINAGFLGFFKYYNFFAVSFAELISNFGLKADPWTLRVILPVGISFYTFHGISYIIDIYNEKIKPEKNFINYSLFVSFFPLLVAGPIERATHLLPQLQKKRQFDYSKAIQGLKQILWGFFKKIVIADQCAIYANMIFNGSGHFSGSTYVVGSIFFAVQIYGDFSGYSDIALGTAKLFGIDLLRNFAYPYFSRDIAEFWRRWHISLSSWFRDYLYIPLGGNKGALWMKIMNIFIVFLVSGFWHGANWTFIAWGMLNAVYFLPSMLLKRNRLNLDIVAQGKILPSAKDVLNMSITFAMVCFAWIIFRSQNITEAFGYFSKILSRSLFSKPYCPGLISLSTLITIITTLIFFIIEWFGREEQFAFASIGKNWNRLPRWSTYYALVIITLFYCNNQQPFIYFQF
ncbi:MAG: MBOAT family O-acyltransferase [Parafilimonas sp.]